MSRTRTSRFLAASLVLAATGLGSGCAKERPRPRLVVLYAACSLNKDFLAPYDPSRLFTPNFDRFGKGARVFKRHQTEAGQSGIAFASIFNGCHADKHGAYRHPTRLKPHLYQVTEAFRDAGYDTFFWSGQQMGNWPLGYGQGVPQQNAYPRSPKEPNSYTANDDQFKAILQRLNEDPDYEAFVQINLTLSHSPYHLYAPPDILTEFVEKFPDQYPDVSTEDFERIVKIYDRYRLALQWNFPESVEKLRNHEDPTFRLRDGDVELLIDVLECLYKVAIYRLDKYFGLWLDSIEKAGFLDESLIAFTADHGEILYRENALYMWTHGLQLAPEVLNVPWLLHAPSLGVEPGAYEGVTRSIDVFPTLAGLCGVEIPANAPVDGVDLAPVLLDGEDEPELIAFSHTSTLGDNLLLLFGQNGELAPWTRATERIPSEDVAFCWVGARWGDMTIKKSYDGSSWSYEIHDLATDPGQTKNLWDESNSEHLAMADRVNAYKEGLVRGPFAITALSDEEIEMLEKLGYVEGVHELAEPDEEEEEGR